MAETTNDIENSNIQYDVLWDNREERKRSTTDVACLIIYGMFIFAWIVIAIYAYSQSSVSPFKLVGIVMESLWAFLFFSPSIFFFTWCCILLIIFYFIMLRCCTKITIYITILLEFIVISLPWIAIGSNPQLILLLLFSYILFYIEIQILRKIGLDWTCNIIVNACKAAIAFPSSLLIVLFSVFSSAIFCIFVATVVYCLIYNREFMYMDNNRGLIVTFLIFSGWILIVDSLCILSVLHGMFAIWCKMTNKSLIPNFIVPCRHLFNAYRYHIGSFAYMSIPFVIIVQIIRTICANVQMLKTKFKEDPYNIYCFLVIIGNAFSITSVTCALYGKCFYPSMKDAFKVLIQNPMKFTAARIVITEMIIFGLILIPLTVFGMIKLHISIWNLHNYEMYYAVCVIISIMITSGVIFIFSAAVDSVLFCHLEELMKRENSDATENRENNAVI